MIWARMLAYITGTVDQELLLRNEYLAAENRILRAKSKAGCCYPMPKKLRWRSSRMVKKIERVGKVRLAASTSLFGLPSPPPR